MSGESPARAPATSASTRTRAAMRRTGTSSTDRPRTLLPAARRMQAGVPKRTTGLGPGWGYNRALLMDAFARWLARHPLAVVLANLLVTAVLGFYALQLRIESSLESMLPAGDPQGEDYAPNRATFRGDDVAVGGGRGPGHLPPPRRRGQPRPPRTNARA